MVMANSLCAQVHDRPIYSNQNSCCGSLPVTLGIPCISSLPNVQGHTHIIIIIISSLTLRNLRALMHFSV